MITVRIKGEVLIKAPTKKQVDKIRATYGKALEAWRHWHSIKDKKAKIEYTFEEGK